MSNIEIPENIQSTVQKVLGRKDFHMATTVELAEFIRDLNKPEIKVEPFVIYKVKVRGDDNYRIGFRVEKDATYSWVTHIISAPEKKNAYPVSIYNLGVQKDEEIEVIERWSPELEFGIGDAGDYVSQGREVLVKGIVGSSFVDDDGDVRVEISYAGGIDGSHYVSAKDVAYVEEISGN